MVLAPSNSLQGDVLRCPFARAFCEKPQEAGAEKPGQMGK